MTNKEIYKQAHNRMIMGSKKHGTFDPNADHRDFYQEMIEELLDNINYSIMQIKILSKRRK